MFETKFGQESLKIGRLSDAWGRKSSGKVSAGLPAGPAPSEPRIDTEGLPTCRRAPPSLHRGRISP